MVRPLLAKGLVRIFSAVKRIVVRLFVLHKEAGGASAVLLGRGRRYCAKASNNNHVAETSAFDLPKLNKSVGAEQEDPSAMRLCHFYLIR